MEKINSKIINIKNDFDSLSINDNYNTYKSTDFNSKEIDEKNDSPISIRNMQNKSPALNNPTINLKSFDNKPNKIKNTILLKNNNLTVLIYFIQNYVNDVTNICNKIDSIVYKKITNLFDKHKYYIRFIKETFSLYETFSMNILQVNNTINLHFKKNEITPFNSINMMIENSQELISNYFYEFSKTIQKNILIDGPLGAMKEFYDKMSAISKVSSSILSNITKKRDKLVIKFYNYDKIFENFKKYFNDSDKLQSILTKYDFFMIEYDISKSINKILNKITEFLKTYQNSLYQLKILTNEYISSLKYTIDIYLKESKKMFNIDDKKLEQSLDDMHSEIEQSFFFNSPNINIMSESLKNLQANLITCPLIKNEEIYKDSNFKIDNFHNFDEIIEFMLFIMPSSIILENSSLILFLSNVNKISGIFKNSIKSVLLITLQSNILIFEEKINNKIYEIYNYSNIIFKSINDKSTPFRFEISELKKGMIYNSIYKTLLEALNDEAYNQIENLFVKI